MSHPSSEVAFHKHSGAVYLCAAALLLLLHLPRSAVFEGMEGSLVPVRGFLRDRVDGPPGPVEVAVLDAGSPADHTPEALARTLRIASAGGPSAIGLALGSGLEVFDEAALRPLADELAQSGRTVLSLPLASGGEEQRLTRAPAILAEKAAAVSYTVPHADPLGRATGLVLHGLTRNRALMGSAVELFRLHREIPSFNVLQRGDRLTLKPLPGQPWRALELTLDSRGAIPVDPRWLDSFPRLARAELLAGRISPESLAQRILVFEAPPAASREVLRAPGGRPVTPGEVLACALGSLLRGEVPEPLPWPFEALALAILGLVLATVGYLRPPRTVLVAALVMTALWWAAALYGDSFHHLQLPLARPTSLLALLALAGALRHAYRPVIGVRVEASDSTSQREAQTALGLGIKLLQKGQVDESVKYFQKVARLESDLKGRSQYFLSLVLLRRGETETASTLISGMDFARLPREDAYTLAKELESRGELNTAHTLYEKIRADQAEFRDVSKRLEELQERLSNVSEAEIVEMMVRKLVDRRFGDIELVGRGGMGFVYKGSDSRDGGRPVALKILSPFFANHDTVRTRFLREAGLAARLQHPNIVRIFEVFDHSLPYYSMEFIGALSVKEILAGVERFPPADALELAMQVCDGLALAHRHGVVHRDIKPENLMLDDDCVVKIIDFGIAKILDVDDITATRKRMGTPEYMSPEQVMADPVDHRSDVYSFGVVLYELLTGKVPYKEIQGHVASPFPEPDAALELPASLVAILRRTMAKSRDDRPDSMEELRGELAAIHASLAAASQEEVDRA